MFCPSGDFTGALENGERADGPLHAGDGDTRRLADGTRPASRQPQAHHPPVANAALHKAHPNRHCFIPQTFPRGDRRALPAPAQGINPLRIPFWGTGRPQRRRRQAPARGPAAVYPLHRPNRNVPQCPIPLLMGHGRVYPEPKALAAGTAGSASVLTHPPLYKCRLPAIIVGRNALKGTASAFPLSKRAGAGASPAEGCGGDRPGAAGRTLLPVGRAGSARYSAGAFLRAASGRFAPTWVVPR